MIMDDEKVPGAMGDDEDNDEGMTAPAESTDEVDE